MYLFSSTVPHMPKIFSSCSRSYLQVINQANWYRCSIAYLNKEKLHNDLTQGQTGNFQIPLSSAPEHGKGQRPAFNPRFHSPSRFLAWGTFCMCTYVDTRIRASPFTFQTATLWSSLGPSDINTDGGVICRWEDQLTQGGDLSKA